jgi:glycosyltransferase involved in cell wall biosynthesis
MNADVTVLIPAHGDSPFLLETLQSIDESSLIPSEILVVNDRLNPETFSLLSRLSLMSPLRVVSNDGTGLVDALNTGLKHSKSKYICRIDNDDLMDRSRIEIQVRMLEENPQWVAVGTQCIYIDELGQIRGKSAYPVGDLRRNEKFRTRCLIAHPSSMFLKTAALSVGGYRSIFKWNGVDIAEDFDFWLRLSKLGNIEVIDEFLTFYRQHANQLSSKNSIGQFLGTPYIAALNLNQALNPICLEFTSTEFSQRNYLVRVIKNTFGFKKAASAYLTFFIVREYNSFHSKILKRAISRLVNYLNN